MKTKLILAGLLCLPSGGVVLAAPRSSVTLPKPGSALRREILNTLRKPIEREVKQTVVFYDVTLRIKSDWAYVSATPRDTKGRQLRRYSSPLTDPDVAALLRRQGKRWKLLDWGASTDAEPIIRMRHRYPKAPRSLFPSMPNDFPGDAPFKGNGFNNRD